MNDCMKIAFANPDVSSLIRDFEAVDDSLPFGPAATRDDGSDQQVAGVAKVTFLNDSPGNHCATGQPHAAAVHCRKRAL